MVTIEDVARRAGVSKTTVSLVLNARHESVGIKEATCRHVLSIAQEMGYRRNELMRAVLTRKNPVLAFLACAPELEFKGRVLAGAAQAANEENYFFKVLHLPGNRVQQQTLETCLEQRVAGVIAMSLSEPDLSRLHETMMAQGIPVATVDDTPPENWGLRVITDDAHGMKLGVEHLAELGHERIAFISGQAASPLAMQREAGYQAAMKSKGLECLPEWVRYGNWNGEDTAQATRELMRLEGTDRPTAIMCAGDEWAAVVLRQLRELGLRVPHDVSVVGYGDLTAARMVDPPLTTIAQPFEEVGRLAAQGLIERIAAASATKTWNDAPEEKRVPPHLVVRASTSLPVDAASSVPVRHNTVMMEDAMGGGHAILTGF